MLIKISTFLKSSGKHLIELFTSSRFVTSSSYAKTLTPNLFFKSFDISSINFFLRALIIRLAPSFANLYAHALPIPEDAPVINTIFHFNDCIISSKIFNKFNKMKSIFNSINKL